MTKITEVVKGLCTPIADELGVELIDVEYKKEGGSYVLRIIIDKPGGVLIEDCENISSLLSDKLDESDPIAGSYTLEVQSPGERSLKNDWELNYFKGRDVEIKLYKPESSRKIFEGELLGIEDDNIRFISDGETREFPRDKVANVKLKIRF